VNSPENNERRPLPSVIPSGARDLQLKATECKL
jgi:hypothetical protein